MVNVNVNQETVKRSYTIILINLTFEFVKVVHNTKGQERKKNALISCRKIDIIAYVICFLTKDEGTFKSDSELLMIMN